MKKMSNYFATTAPRRNDYCASYSQLDFLGLGTQILELDDGLLVTSRQQTSSAIVSKNYQKATHEETDLWLLKNS